MPVYAGRCVGGPRPPGRGVASLGSSTRLPVLITDSHSLRPRYRQTLAKFAAAETTFTGETRVLALYRPAEFTSCATGEFDKKQIN